ncbi:CGNR zinc finger domain-containing protein [Actinophytocola sp. NPDC049390]|uniref:CGNR zinc finger domain-containing protein n=1 Tax=Actinophytocola sp. NPDC049390 TaxID=3363894 RepID=UPI0037AE4CDC
MTGKLPPYAVRAGGRVLPKPIAGHPALELCNTLAGWDDPPDARHEWLRDHEHLAVWVEFTGLLPHCPRTAGTEVLAEVRELRAVAYRLLRHRDAAALPAFAAWADEANAHRRLVGEPGGGARFRLPTGDDPRLPVHASALAVADLLADPALATVRACPGDGCGWLFLDPRGRRVWCSMAACGNRSKVRAHAARRQTSGG